MKNCFTFFAALLFFWAAAAQSEIGFSVYRDADGQISAQSAANLEAMVDMAKQAGFVRVWIGFDYPFQSDPALRTPVVVAAEAASKQAAMAEIVLPLIHQGKATHIAADQTSGAPGCMLVVNHKALKTLSRDEGVIYIGYLPDSE